MWTSNSFHKLTKMILKLSLMPFSKVQIWFWKMRIEVIMWVCILGEFLQGRTVVSNATA